MKHTIALLSLIVGILLGTTALFAETPLAERKEVVVIHAYQRDYKQTEILEKGIKEAFADADTSVKIRYEYLDALNYYSATYFTNYAMMLAEKYKDVPVDGIILCNDDALDFYIAHGTTIFGEQVPVVATSINAVSSHKPFPKGITVVEERPNFKKTIQVALEQNKTSDVKRLHFILDNTTTGRSMRDELASVVKTFYSDYEAYYYNTLSPSALKTLLDKTGASDVFFYVLYSRDQMGQAYFYEDVAAYIIDGTEHPVYVFWDFFLETGAVGGYVVDSAFYGRAAADYLLDAWMGRPLPEVVYERESGHYYAFDHQVVQAFDIEPLPEGARLFNAPQSYFERNKYVLVVFVPLTLVLLVIIALLTFGFRQKQSAFEKEKTIHALNVKMMAAQKDIISFLGDIVETRSMETGDHVKRVAKVSGFVGRHCGLSDEAAHRLEMISPMHDVGKIVIPERILQKPGKLTVTEFDEMKTHTVVGHDLLSKSDQPILNEAAVVALEHHERWDGNGYPSGKSGEDIHIFARITSIADVYDALRSERVYKKAWDRQSAVDLLAKERGKAFDPALVDVFLAHVDEIESLRDGSFVPDSTKN